MSAILHHMPHAKFVTVIFLILVFVFLATTIDSSAYVLAAVCTKELKEDEQPARWNRMVWAFVLMLLSLSLLLVGGLKVIQTASLVAGFPIIFIYIIILISLYRSYRTHFNLDKERCLQTEEKVSFKTKLLGKFQIIKVKFQNIHIFFKTKFKQIKFKLHKTKANNKHNSKLNITYSDNKQKSNMGKFKLYMLTTLDNKKYSKKYKIK